MYDFCPFSSLTLLSVFSPSLPPPSLLPSVPPPYFPPSLPPSLPLSLSSAYPIPNRAIKAIKTHTVPLHSDVTIPCVFTPGVLRERYSVKWFKGLTAVNTTDPRVSILKDFSLVINDVIATDASSAYYCVVDVASRGDLVIQFHATGPSMELVVTGESIVGVVCMYSGTLSLETLRMELHVCTSQTQQNNKTHSHTHSLTHSHSHTHSLTLTHSHSHTHSLTLPHSLTLLHSTCAAHAWNHTTTYL